MKSFKKIFSKTITLVLIIVYLVSSIRYFQGNISKTVLETLIHMLTVAPFFIGGTLLLVSAYRKLTGERPPWETIIRIYITIGIIVEFIWALHHLSTKADMPVAHRIIDLLA